jgi:hypothetical protein
MPQCFRLDDRRRTAVGIGAPEGVPPPTPGHPNWLQPLLDLRQVWFPTLRRQQGLRTYDDTADVVRTRPTSYATKLAAVQTGPDSGPSPFPIHGWSNGFAPPWPVGTTVGQPTSPQGRDVPRVGPEVVRPVYMPRTARYGALHSSSPGWVWDPGAVGPAPRRDLIPVGGRQQMFRIRGRDVVPVVPSDASLGYGLDYGPAPWRVPFIRKPGMQLMAGPSQYSTQQQWAGVSGVGAHSPSGSILIAPPVWSDITRGTRGVSGILQRVQGPGRMNVPAVFVPSEVR